MNISKAMEFCTFHKILQDHLLSNQPQGVSAEFLTKKIIEGCEGIYGCRCNTMDDISRADKLLEQSGLPYRIALASDKVHLGLEIDKSHADTPSHIYKLMNIFSTRMMKLHIHEDMTFDTTMRDYLLETFTKLYNIAYDPFFVCFTDKIYQIDEVNMLLQMRKIPFYIRTFVAPGGVCRYEVVNANWGNY